MKALFRKFVSFRSFDWKFLVLVGTNIMNSFLQGRNILKICRKISKFEFRHLRMHEPFDPKNKEERKF